MPLGKTVIDITSQAKIHCVLHLTWACVCAKDGVDPETSRHQPLKMEQMCLRSAQSLSYNRSVMKFAALLLLLLATLVVSGCGPDDGTPEDSLCSADEAPTATLGKGVGSAFIPYEDNEEVGIQPASQGGFGVPVLVRTTGLTAGSASVADVQLNVEEGGALVGEFLQENTGLSCRGDDIGGEVRGVVVGFDPEVYATNDDLLVLDGTTVDLVVTVIDEEGNSATVRKPVIIRVGG